MRHPKDGDEKEKGRHRGRIVAVLFTAALALLMASLVDFTREIRVRTVHVHLESASS